MSSYLSVRQVVDTTLPTVLSIEVRTFSFDIEGCSYNAVTTIGLSEHSVEQNEKLLAELLAKHPSFGDERLRFHHRVRSIDQWSNLKSELRSGVLHFSGNEVKLMRSVEIDEYKGYIGSMNFLRPKTDWPVYEANGTWTPNQQNAAEAAISQRLRYINNDPDLTRHLNANGYPSLKEVFRTYLHSRAGSEPSYASDVYVTIPLLAAVRELRFQPNESRLFIAYDCHPSLQRKVRAFGAYRKKSNETEPLQFGEPTPNDELSYEASSPMCMAEDINVVDTYLSHGDLGYVASKSATPQALLPAEELNPLWHLLQTFCPPETFKQLLLSHPKPKDKQLKEQRLYELHVAWLLSLYGFSTIVLGEFESLRAPDSPVELGSLDLLAYHRQQNTVLLGACTLGAPEERDYSTLVNVRAHLRSKLNKGTSFQMRLALFSGAAECVSPLQYGPDQSAYVAVLDSGDISEILSQLSAGRDEYLWRKISGSPEWSYQALGAFK